MSAEKTDWYIVEGLAQGDQKVRVICEAENPNEAFANARSYGLQGIDSQRITENNHKRDSVIDLETGIDWLNPRLVLAR